MAKQPVTAVTKAKPKAPVAAVVESKILAFLDRIDDAGIGGWAVDFAQPAEEFAAAPVLIDDVNIDTVKCDLQRDDAALLNLPVSRIGFYYNIPPRYHDGLRHVLRFATIEGTALPMSSRSGAMMAELSFCLAKPVRVEGVVDGMIDGLIQGWALNVDERAGTRLGGLRILVTTGGQPVAELLADQYRADVAESVGCDTGCGFAFSPPPELRSRRRTEFRFFAMPGRHELRGSPFEVSYPQDSERERIAGLVKRADELFTFAYHLRKELKAALPGNGIC